MAAPPITTSAATMGQRRNASRGGDVEDDGVRETGGGFGALTEPGALAGATSAAPQRWQLRRSG
jgi:hypothetical protein